MKRRTVLSLLTVIAVLLTSSLSNAGQTLTTVSVTSSSTGTQVVNAVGGGVVVTVPSNAAGAVWFAMVAGTCSDVLITQVGIRITAGNGYFFQPKVDQWFGQVCAILESGSSAVTVSVNAF